MVRLATPQDIPWLTEQMLALMPHTAWAKASKGYKYNYDTVHKFIVNQLSRADSVCYVWDGGVGDISAFCAGSCSQFYLPPYVPLMFEWGMAGPKHEIKHCWLALRQWAKRHNIEWIGRVKAEPGKSSVCVTEHMVWKRLI